MRRRASKYGALYHSMMDEPRPRPRALRRSSGTSRTSRPSRPRPKWPATWARPTITSEARCSASMSSRIPQTRRSMRSTCSRPASACPIAIIISTVQAAARRLSRLHRAHLAQRRNAEPGRRGGPRAGLRDGGREEVSWPSADRRDIDKINNPMSIAELADLRARPRLGRLSSPAPRSRQEATMIVQRKDGDQATSPRSTRRRRSRR